MAYTSGYTAVTGATYTASNYNTYVRDNLAAIWVFTAAGDLIYATGANTASRLPIGTPGQILQVAPGGTAPQWATIPLIYKRQGGSSTDWSSPGATNYTPASAVMQCGVFTIGALPTGTHEFYNTKTITFPTAFSAVPIVVFIAGAGDYLPADTWWQVAITSRNVSSFSLTIKISNDAYTFSGGSLIMDWMAIGAP